MISPMRERGAKRSLSQIITHDLGPTKRPTLAGLTHELYRVTMQFYCNHPECVMSDDLVQVLRLMQTSTDTLMARTVLMAGVHKIELCTAWLDQSVRCALVHARTELGRSTILI